MWYGKASRRRIAKTLGVSRKGVNRVIREHEQARTGTLPSRKRQPKSVLDPFQDQIAALLARYPDITAVRLHQELGRRGFQVFTEAYVMTQGGPARATYFFTMYLYDNAFRFLRMGYASAMAWIQLLVILALTGLAFWSSKRWVHYQGK